MKWSMRVNECLSVDHWFIFILVGIWITFASLGRGIKMGYKHSKWSEHSVHYEIIDFFCLFCCIFYLFSSPQLLGLNRSIIREHSKAKRKRQKILIHGHLNYSTHHAIPMKWNLQKRSSTPTKHFARKASKQSGIIVAGVS